MLISIKKISKTTAIPETTIRRYIQVFNDVLPQGTRLGRTKKYPSEMADTIKTIHTSYQKGLSTVEIQGELSGTNMTELVEQIEITTLPPQETISLQADIRALTEAVKDLTEVIQLLPPYYHYTPTTESVSPEEISVSTTTEAPYNHNTTEAQENQKTGIVENEINLFKPPSQHHHDTTNPESSEEELFSNITIESQDNHNNTTTKPLENQKSCIVESETDLSEPPSQHHHDTTDPKTPKKEPFSSVTIESPQNHDNITTEAPEDHNTTETQNNHDTTTAPTPEPVEPEPTTEPETEDNHETTTETTPEPEPEQVIEPQEPTQSEPAPETDEVEEPEPKTEQDQAGTTWDKQTTEEEESVHVEEIPDWKNKTKYREFLAGVFLELEDQKGTWQDKADHLNNRGILTTNGKPWKNNNVRMAAGSLKRNVKV